MTQDQRHPEESRCVFCGADDESVELTEYTPEGEPRVIRANVCETCRDEVLEYIPEPST